MGYIIDLLIRVALILTIFVAIFTAIFVSQRNMQQSAINIERCKWRDSIKKTTGELDFSDIDSLNKGLVVFQLNLNPFDSADSAILLQIKEVMALLSNQDQNNTVQIEQHKKEILMNVSFLLKHDWERYKHESSMLCFFRSEPKRAVVANIFFDPSESELNINRTVCCNRGGTYYLNRHEIVVLDENGKMK